MDADLQMAVALSESLQNQGKAVVREVATEENPEGNTAVNAFSVLLSPKPHKHTKRKTK